MPLIVLVLGGGTGVFEECLGSVRAITLRTYDGDLSYPYCSLASRSADLALSLEVVEHLKDQATVGISAHWQGSGVFTHLREIARVLRPDGRALLTTPNLASYDGMARLMQGRGPSLFPPHVRELTRRELSFLMEQAGLRPLAVATLDTYPHSRSARAPFEALALRTGFWHDHNQTLFALGAPRDLNLAGSVTDRLLPLWKKRIAHKLPGADTLARAQGCEQE